MPSFPIRAAMLAAITLLPLVRANAQLAAVGPVHAEHGFPSYYRDAAGHQFAPCLGSETLCLLDAAADLLNPSQPFPQNYGGVFPSHVFYNAAEATLTTAGGGLGLLVMALQGGFGNDLELPVAGDQFVMARLRLRIDNLVAGASYHITTPYGVFDLVAQNGGRRSINFTTDVPGPIPGAFADAMNGPIGPTFLRWDSDLPIVDAAGNNYVGDPAIEHTITGSPFGTNYFRIEGPNVGGSGIHSLQTNLFSVIGMIDPGEPIADLTAMPTSGTAPLLVAFADQTIGAATSWLWDFGDGNTSTEQHPTHVYTAPGVYTVRLVVSGPNGADTCVHENEIAVEEPVLTLHEPTPVGDGQTQDFLVTGVTPGADVYLYASTALGSSALRARVCNETSGLLTPTLVARCRAAGTSVTIRAKIPRLLIGHTVHLQVLDLADCEVSAILAAGL